MSRPWVWWILLLGWAFLLFAQLGHYALWDDESLVALSAEAVQRTGDTGVLLDHGNIVAYRDGLCVRDFADRSTPPLATYLCAASFDFLGRSAFTARLPFALLGLGTGALLLLWARDTPAPARWVFVAALFANVSLILFSRQCRYYSPAIFFSLAIVFAAWRWRQGPWQLLILAALSVCLFAANFISYVALYGVLAVDYVLWRRKEKPLGLRDALVLFLPQLVLIGAIASVWNPFHTAFGSYENTNTLPDRLTLYFRCWRDLDRCEFFALPLVLLALAVGLVRRRGWLARGCVALAVYLALIALTSPQPIRLSVEAEVRYLTPILPLALALQAGALVAVLGRWRGWLVLVTAIAFGTNLLNGGPFFDWGLRSTILSYLGELSLPQAEPYTPTAAWINANVPENATIWVNPYYASYPLMFAAPRATYGWQLSWPPRADFAALPPIDFAGRVSPDYIVAFGPAYQSVVAIEKQNTLPGFHYELAQSIPVYWQDKYRPELYWRRFETFTNFDPAKDAVFIFRRVGEKEKAER
jgi:hypothetical protein